MICDGNSTLKVSIQESYEIIQDRIRELTAKSCDHKAHLERHKQLKQLEEQAEKVGVAHLIAFS